MLPDIGEWAEMNQVYVTCSETEAGPQRFRHHRAGAGRPARNQCIATVP
jgi:hypothetical protein